MKTEATETESRIASPPPDSNDGSHDADAAASRDEVETESRTGQARQSSFSDLIRLAKLRSSFEDHSPEEKLQLIQVRRYFRIA